MANLSNIITPTNVLTATSTNTVTNKTIAFGDNTFTGALSVANGGTGVASLTANNVILGNGTSAVQVVAPGTSGNVLTSNGTTWSSTAIPASSGWVLLSTLTASNSASINFTSLISSTYDNYVVLINSLNPQNSSQSLLVRFSTNNGSAWISGNRTYRFNVFTLAGNLPSYFADPTATSMYASQNAGVDTNTGLSGQVTLFDLPSATTNARIMSQTTYKATNAFAITSGSYLTAASINAVQFLMSTGNIVSGTFSLYGITD